MEDQIPDTLVKEIRSGNCVAFVGAGFSAPAVPPWDDLLKRICEEGPVCESTRKRVTDLLEQSNRESQRGVFDREAVGEILQQELGEKFDGVVDRVVKNNPDADRCKMAKRIESLGKIPFQSILTTNFDDYLTGQSPSPEIYRKILRKSKNRWTNLVNWDQEKCHKGKDKKAEVIKLHGQIGKRNKTGKSDIVLSRSDYRRLLFEGSQYLNFLRGVLSTRTILFLGFSFSDPYLNLLRSETMAMLEYKKGDDPLAYAIINDIDKEEETFLLDHEGIEVLSFSTKGENDYSDFDTYLELIQGKTQPEGITRELLSAKKLLWLDANPRNNEYGYDVLTSDSQINSTKPDWHIEQVHTSAEALEKLNSTEFDLIISHWGHGKAEAVDGNPRAIGEELLEKLGNSNILAPVIIFAAPDPLHVGSNRSKALKLGAFEYCWEWKDLFDAIERLLSGPESR